MPPLTRSEREEFLQQPGVLCRVATVDERGAPHVTPVWFAFEDGQIYITPRQHSAWLAHLRRDPRIALTIDEEAAPYRKVTLRGAATIAHEVGEDDAWRDLYRRIAKRYVPAEAADFYVDETIDQPRALVAVPLAGSEVRTWRMPVAGEAYSGIWHDRYYVPGSKITQR